MWWEHAACAGMAHRGAPAWDNPARNSYSGSIPRAAMRPLLAAIAICRTCPVTAECLAEGQRFKADGVWGGLLLSDGRALAKQPTEFNCGHPREGNTLHRNHPSKGPWQTCRICHHKATDERHRRKAERRRAQREARE